METAIGTQQTALLVIDAQNDVIADGYDKDGVVTRLAQAIARAREQLVPVIFIQHEEPDYPPMNRGAEGWKIDSRIAPLEGEIVIGKLWGDAYVDTDLKETLEDLDITHLVIGGAQSDACIRAAIYRSLIEGFDVTLLGDAHTTCDRVLADGSVIPAKQIIDHVTLTTRFLEYPGQSTRVITTDELVFNPPVPQFA
jgi:nicotinamidase-related amidase